MKESVQNYDAVTTAKIEWVEDLDAPGGCPCRLFFPARGTIDWSYRYEVKSESIDCNVTAEGHLDAGTGLSYKEEQMIGLWEIPGDDTQYYFTGTGGVNDVRTIFCEGEGTTDVTPTAFMDVPLHEDIVTPTPAFAAAVAPAGSERRLCDAAPFKYDRDAKQITGSCYGGYWDDEFSLEYVEYEWNVDLCLAASTSFALVPTDADKDGDRIPNGVEDGIGTNPLCPDTDSDGLLDSWEVAENVQGAGFDLDHNNVAEAKRDEVFGPYAGHCGNQGTGPRREPRGQNCGLVSAPDPLHKDVYVEMDWQDCLLGSCPELVLPTGFNNLAIPIDPAHHAPDMAGLLDVVNTFRNAPVQNPDGDGGVKLHILVDEAIPHLHNCDKGTAATRGTNFGTPQQRASPNLGVMAAKAVAFRYAWSGHSSAADNTENVCPLPSFTDVLASGLGLAPLPFYDISPHGFAQPRGRDILVTLGISWICQLYTFDSGEYTPPCFRHEALGVPVAPGLYEAQISERGGGPPVNVAIPQHVSLGVSPSQGVRQIWGRTFMNLLGYSLGVPAGKVGNDPNAYGAHPPDSYTSWDDLDYAPPKLGAGSAQPQSSSDGFVPIFPDFSLAEQDGDGDGTAEGIDNCPALSNSDQVDLDLDELGDDCDDDDDGDNSPDDEDTSPLDTDNDGTPNASDGDADGDGAENGTDNCPLQVNADQANADGDAAGDACDADSDGDGQADVLERATGSDPIVAGSMPEFLGLSDSCTDAADNDGDGDTDGADDGCADADGDTAPDSLDNCPDLATINLLDSDGDGVGDLCDPEHLSGDVDCNGTVNSIDALKLSRHVAGLPVAQTEPCPDIGTGDGARFGEVNCDGNITAVDALFVLRFVAALPVNVPQGCRAVGT